MAKRFRSCTLVAALLAALFCCGEAAAQGKKPALSNAGPKPSFGPEVKSVFFEDATKHLGAGSLPGDDGGAVSTPGAGGRTPPPAMANTPSAAPSDGGGEAGSGEWSKLIAREVLEDEIKAQTGAMAISVKAKGKFKSGGYKDAALQLSSVATMFGIIALYDSPDVRWKDLAASLRDKLAKAGLACKEGSDESHKLATEASTLLSELVGGGKVELPPATGSNVPWPNVADLPPLMRRMEQSQSGVVKPGTANAAEFKAVQAKVVREAMFLQAMGRIIQDDGYNEEEDYKNFAKAMQAGAASLLDAAKQGQFEAAQSAAGLISKSCDDCHTKFK